MAGVPKYLQTVTLEPERKEHNIDRHVSQRHFPYKAKFNYQLSLHVIRGQGSQRFV
jgi:hypothetical protein